MAGIYRPEGRAGEYSPLAFNVYNGCDHNCAYCYMQRFRRFDKVVPIKNVLASAKSSAKKHAGTSEQVLFCFSCDPYCNTDVEHQLTRSVLRIFLNNQIPVTLLSKGGKRMFRDIDIIEAFGQSVTIGATLTFSSDKESLIFEPGAALPQERVDVLSYFHDMGVKTWASLEPVIDVRETMEIVKRSLHAVDHYKIGKINNWRSADKGIDWALFLSDMISFMQANNKTFYVKEDLYRAAGKPECVPRECLVPNGFVAKPFAQQTSLF